MASSRRYCGNDTDSARIEETAMLVLIVGLVLFLGVHSVRIVADGWRSRQIARLGAGGWKGLYTAVSLVGFAAIVWGYGLSRSAAVVVWTPPPWAYHLTIALTLPALILIVAANVPGNHFKAWLGHPMLAGTKLWAAAHLASNGRLGDMVLFGAFLIWAIAAFVNARRRDRLAGVTYGRGTLTGTVLTLVVGAALYAAFALWLHRWLIGVDPMVWMAAR
jgi:uncharacterized membrane protein